MVPDWKEVVKRLRVVMLERWRDLRRPPIAPSANPILVVDLKNARALRHPPKELPATDLPDGFGEDRFEVMVRNEFAVAPESHSVPAPPPPADPEIELEIDSTGAPEPPAPETDSTDASATAALSTGPDVVDLPTPDPAANPSPTDADIDMDTTVDHFIDEFLAEAEAEAATSPPHAIPAPHSPDKTNSPSPSTQELPGAHSSDNPSGASHNSTKRTLRQLTRLSYREPPVVGEGTSKSRQPRLASTNLPKIPPPCCPAEVPQSHRPLPPAFFPRSLYWHPTTPRPRRSSLRYSNKSFTPFDEYFTPLKTHQRPVFALFLPCFR